MTQRNFAGGELAPSQHKKVDLLKYATGARTIRNFIILKDGGLSNRPGSQFMTRAYYDAEKVRLIPFVFNNEQSYVLEFGHHYVRYLKNGEPLFLPSINISGISKASQAVVTSTAHGLFPNDLIYISEVQGMVEITEGYYLVGVVPNANTFVLRDYVTGSVINSTAFSTYTSGGTIAKPVMATNSPYAAGELQDIQFIQSADVMTLVHPNHEIAEIKRMSDTNWSFSTALSLSAPSVAAFGFNAAAGGGTTPGSTQYFYKVTSINMVSGEESYPSGVITATNGNATLSQTNYNVIGWTPFGGVSYKFAIYKLDSGSYGLIGYSEGTGFKDIGILPDTSTTPPRAETFFDDTGKYPSSVAIIQQRRLFANTNLEPEAVWASRTGLYSNFTGSTPVQDDDAIKFTMAGRQVNAVRYILDLDGLVIFTQAGEWSAGGNAQGILTPTGLNLKQFSYNGAAKGLPPIVIDNMALYVQARGSAVRTIGAKVATAGYEGDDLTAFAWHLFKNKKIKDWAYQQTPNSILWTVRDDGTLVALTYVREQAIFGWHRHDTDGFVEQVCTVPEGEEDAVYIVVRREINGVAKRYIERLNSRNFTSLEDSTLLDSYLSYDGRNYDANHSMTLSGGTTWSYTEELTLTSSASFFKAGDVGNEIHLVFDGEERLRLKITAYTSGTVVKVKANKDVPVPMRSVAIFEWRRAVDELSGLDHLEGKAVSVFADGFVVSNPNNDKYPTAVVTGGKITLNKCYGLIHVGLPYVSDLETLDIDTAQGESIVAKMKNVGKVIISILESKAFWVGPKAPVASLTDGLTEMKSKNFVNPDLPADPKTSDEEITLQSQWNSNGRVFSRVIDPVPVTILAVSPVGLFPFKGGN